MSAPEAATEVGSSVNGHRKKLLSGALGLYGVNDRGRAPRSIVTLRGRALGGCALSQSHKIVVVDDTEVEDDLAIDMTEAFDEFLRSPDALAPWRPEPGLEGSRLRRSSSAVRPACEYIEMGKLEVPHGWVCQAYRFEVARCCRHQSIASHQGARRFAWNWGLSLIEEQLHARGAYRVLALRQGATEEQSAAWARDMVPIPWSMIAIRRIWNEQKHEVAPWWGENSKEAYSSAFEALERAFKSYFSSRAGERRGLRVGWPKYKSRSQRRSVAFTTGAIAIVDRHHVKLPVIGVLRVKEPTDKLRLRIGNGSSRILRATLTGEGSATFVSFSVLVERHSPSLRQQGVCGHDVGISTLVTSSDGLAVENDRPADAQRLRISRYQRMMNRQHRTGSPNCFADNGAHIAGRCLWKNRSKRAKENQARLVKAHQRAARIRHDAIHKASYRTATTFSVNIVEDLCVAGMVRRGQGKRGFNAALSDAALGELRRHLSYKCAWYGSSLWVADRWYPSSKLCSACKTLKVDLKRSDRIFRCEQCGLSINRDLNAAKNLAALAELAAVCLMAQMLTGKPINWSKLPVRPANWEQDRKPRSSRDHARARGRKAKGGERKTARAVKGGDCSFDRQAAVATGSNTLRHGVSPSPKKVVA